jgi:uncharacterized protein with PQ loop repeat
MAQISHKPHHKKGASKFGDIMYFAAIFGPLLTIPQLLKIWKNGSATELSFLTWFSYFAISALWFFYGLKTKDKPLILCNGLYLIVNFLIVLSIYYWNY